MGLPNNKARQNKNPKARKREGVSSKVPDIFASAALNDVPALSVAVEHQSINSQDDLDMSALHHAAGELAGDAIDFLLSKGIDTTLTDKFGRKASRVAVEVWGDAGMDISERIRFYEAERTILTPDMANHPRAGR